MDSHNLGTGRSVRETEKALLVYIEDLDDEVWIPKSQIHADSDVWQSDQDGDVIVSSWFAEKEGWVD